MQGQPFCPEQGSLIQGLTANYMHALHIQNQSAPPPLAFWRPSLIQLAGFKILQGQLHANCALIAAVSRQRRRGVCQHSHLQLAVHVKTLLHGHAHLGLGLAATDPRGLFRVGLSLGQLSLQVSNHLPISHLHHRQIRGCKIVLQMSNVPQSCKFVVVVLTLTNSNSVQYDWFQLKAVASIVCLSYT